MASLLVLYRRLLLALFLFVLGLYACLALSDAPQLKIAFLDVGQGDAIFIEAPNGNQMLIDGGPPGGALLRNLSKVMKWHDRHIDVIVLTHPDADHAGGLPELLERYEVGLVLEPGSKTDSAIYKELEKRIESKKIPKVLARRGMRINLGDGAALDILFPDRDVSYLETNSSSIVGKLSYGSTSAMLMGDSPKSIESSLLKAYGSRLKSDILKAGHHGSRTSTGRLFAETIDPMVAIISSGEGNSYGHPHEEVLQLLNDQYIDIARTDKEGTIRFVSDGKIFKRK